MLNFIYVNPALINQKTKENIRESEIRKLTQLKQDGYILVGLEMTTDELAKYCDINVDPQHTDQKITQSCVKEICLNHEQLFKDLLPFEHQKFIFLTNRVDLDSISAYIVANSIVKNEKISYNRAIQQINAHDTFSSAHWEKEKSIEEAFNPNNQTKALASTIKPFMVTKENIENVERFIYHSTVDEAIMETYRNTQQSIINKAKSGEIKTYKNAGIAFVETTLPCATDIGYCYAPIVVATNPKMRSADGTTYRKISICQHEEGYVDLRKVKEALCQKEEGWGGSLTFIGSPQGVDTTLSLKEIQKIVYQNLTLEYKQKVSSSSLPDTSLEK